MRRLSNRTPAFPRRLDPRARSLATLLLVAIATAPTISVQPYFADVTQAKNRGNFRAIAGDGHGPGGGDNDNDLDLYVINMNEPNVCHASTSLPTRRASSA